MQYQLVFFKKLLAALAVSGALVCWSSRARVAAVAAFSVPQAPGGVYARNAMAGQTRQGRQTATASPRAAAPDQSRPSPARGRGGEGYSVGETSTAVLSHETPALTPAQVAQYRRWQQQAPLVPPSPGVPTTATTVRVAPAPATSAPVEQLVRAVPQAPHELVIPFNKDMTASEVALSQRSLRLTPSVANRGNTVFYTGDWFAALSTDGGQTFNYINPATRFSNVNGGFCCNQITTFVPEHDMTVWLLQYQPDSTNNTIRIARAVGEQLANNTWTSYSFTPELFGLPASHQISNPTLAVGANWLYVTGDIFRLNSNSFVSSLVFRLSLDDLAAGVPVRRQHFLPETVGSPRCTEGAGETMYFAALPTTQSVRIFSWPDAASASSITSVDIALSYPYTFMNLDGVALSPDGTNWAGRAFSRIYGAWVSRGVIGLIWVARQDATRNRAYPYTVVARFDETNRTLLSQEDIWHEEFAWLYPSLAVNAVGDLGLSLYFGGGRNYPTAVVALIDEITGNFAGLNNFLLAGSTAGPRDNYWGDPAVTVRPHKHEPNTFAAAAYYLDGGGESSNTVPRYSRFGRERDFIYCGLQPITPGQTVNGSLSNSDCRAVLRRASSGVPYADRYRFSGVSGQAVTLTQNSAAFDSYLNLIGPDGAAVASDDDSAGNRDARITTTLRASGNYVIEATSFSAGDSGAYTLSLVLDCAYAIAPSSQSFNAAGGTGSVAVTAGSGCAWTASSQATWLTITAGGSGSGNGTVGYAVAANPTTSPRSGTLTIAGQTFTVTQVGVTPNPAPTLSSLNPSLATAGSASLTLTLNGTNFVSGATVRWNGSNRVTGFSSSTQLTATIPASDLANAGTASVTVFNPAPGGGSSGVLTFTINAPANPVPSLTSLTPNSITAGSTGFLLQVNGANFVGNSIVRWNGSDRLTSFVNSTQLSAQIMATDVAAPGNASITVFTLPSTSGGGGLSNALSFTITQPGNPVPVLTSLNPATVTAGGAAFTLTVNGTNLVNGAVVRWNGNNRPTTFVSNTQVTAQIPASDIAAAGTARVTVLNPAPGGGASNELSLLIEAPPSGNTISGTVAYAIRAQPVAGVTVTATTGETVVKADTSNDEGRYFLRGLPNGLYTVTPTKSGSRNGISAYDAALILQDEARIIQLTSDQLQAADVDGNGRLNGNDADLIARYLVGLSGVGRVGEWAFAPPREVYALNGDLPNQNYRARLLGEVSGNWSPGAGPTVTNVLWPVAGEARATEAGWVVHGAGFAPGLSLSLVYQDGVEIRLTAPMLEAVSTEAFSVRLPLLRGVWALRVVNADGRSSDWFVFKAQ